uniref:Solute carrier family 40 protein n=1 Tax=Angiostrongylus cantonensis TaxID=6313 RepID=A0A0K0DLV3_ANGCA
MKSATHDNGAKTSDDQTTVISSSLSTKYDAKESPWKSLWISISLQYMIGIQISIYFMSMWPYLSALDRTATVDFFGWVVAACSLGCSIVSGSKKFVSFKTFFHKMAQLSLPVSWWMAAAQSNTWARSVPVSGHWISLGSRVMTRHSSLRFIFGYLELIQRFKSFTP